MVPGAIFFYFYLTGTISIWSPDPFCTWRTSCLPTAAERHSRGDVEDDLPVSSTCPICSQHGSHIQHRHHIIARSINNTFRQFTQPSPIHTHATDPYDQLLASTDIEELNGWENATTDKHGRSTILAQGEPSYSVLGQQFSQPWLRHIFHTHNTPWTAHLVLQ